MAVYNKNKKLKILQGNVPVKSIQIGSNGVYGIDSALFSFKFPAAPEGVEIIVNVNNKLALPNPDMSGSIDVHYGDELFVCAHAKEGYYSPVSSLQHNGEQVEGTTLTSSRNGITADRGISYNVVVNGDITLAVQPTSVVPTVQVPIVMDNGFSEIKLSYVCSPYQDSYYHHKDFDKKVISENDECLTFYEGSAIRNTNHLTTIKEGYKKISVTATNYETLTADTQCTINAVSKAGTKVSIVCPNLPNGVACYRIVVKSSDYSRKLASNYDYARTNHYGGSETVSTRQIGDATLYYYAGDTIEISALRVDGYKYPNLGLNGNIANKTLKTTATLAGTNTLVVQAGEKGKVVNFINEPLETSEFAYCNVISEYNDGNTMETNPPIYVGDTIIVPLNPTYRIGSYDFRKPAVGFSDGTNILLEPSFTSTASLQVPDITSLTLVLQQGSSRENVTKTSGMPRLFEYSYADCRNVQWGQSGYYDESKHMQMEDGYGDEGYFVNSLKVYYRCKRYLGDLIYTKYYCYSFIANSEFTKYYDTPLDYVKVLQGEVEFDENHFGVEFDLDYYNDIWVANNAYTVNAYPYEIRI